MHYTLKQLGLFSIQKFRNIVGSNNDDNDASFSRLSMPPGLWSLHMIKYTKIKNKIKV